MKSSSHHILIILDGYGIAQNPEVSAIDQAQKPFLDSLFAQYPHSHLLACGLAVGLPEGQMGNSEVGHTNLGAGRVVYQDITRIDKEIKDGVFFENESLIAAIQFAKTYGNKLHLIGLVSDGGVHSSNQHIYALLKLCKAQDFDNVFIHAFTDGRDTDPQSGAAFIAELEAQIEEIGVGKIATIVGRYYAMDRDNRWERVQKAYDLLTKGEGNRAISAVAALEESYANGVTDEFVLPIVLAENGLIEANDAVIAFNYRSDRMREITKALTLPDFDGFEREYLQNLHYTTFTKYDDTFTLPIAFNKINLTQTLGEVISMQGLTQLRAAETEKYPHVTFFFNGGREEPFAGENRILVNSPKVATYDLQPEMSAYPLAHQVAAFIKNEKPNLVVLNFANPDMVGHTGIMEAAIQAIEAVDACAQTVVEAALSEGYSVQIIADHGNADQMKNEDGSPNTAHSLFPVPHLLIIDGFEGEIKPGKLGDIAPTILKIMNLPQPPEMDGEALI